MITFAITILLALAVQAQQQYHILGGSVKDQDGKPIAGAHVQMGSYSATTASSGGYQIDIYDKDSLNFVITVTAEGHAAYTTYCSFKPNESLKEMEFTLYNALYYDANRRSTIMLPITPDASWGRYFRLDHVDGDSIIFEQELSPKANTPYVFIANANLHIDLKDMDLTPAIHSSTIKVPYNYEEHQASGEGEVIFIGSYSCIEHELLTENFIMAQIDDWDKRDDLFNPMQPKLFYHFLLFPKKPILVMRGQRPKVYPKLLDEGYVWTYCSKGHLVTDKSLCKLSFMKFYFDGERTIDGVTYKSLYEQVAQYKAIPDDELGYRMDSELTMQNPYYLMGVREEKGKVYVYGNDLKDFYNVELLPREDNEYVLYDSKNQNQPQLYVLRDFFKLGLDVDNGIIDTYSLNLFINNGCLEYKSPDFIEDPFYPYAQYDPAYRPFIEEGKVWKVGWFPGLINVSARTEYYYFEGDTIISNRTCKKMMRQQRSRPEWGDPNPHISYVGALYEEDQQVYCAFPKSDKLVLLYDFASAIGDTISVHGGSCVVSRKARLVSPSAKGNITEVALYQDVFDYDSELYTKDYNFEHLVRWIEGIGALAGSPLDNVYEWGIEGNYSIPMSCTIGDEVLYKNINPYLKDGLEDTPSEVKKHWLDFTHTTKPRPKSPKLAAGGESDADKAAEQETLTGEYSAKELFVSLKTLAGPYVITLTDAAGKEVYRKEVQTSNVVALNTDLTKYAEGTYTLTVENSEEQYTASLSLPLIDDAVRDLLDDKSVNSKSVNGKWSDLSGRHLTSTPTRPGLYITGGRKVVIK